MRELMFHLSYSTVSTVQGHSHHVTPNSLLSFEMVLDRDTKVTMND